MNTTLHNRSGKRGVKAPTSLPALCPHTRHIRLTARQDQVRRERRGSLRTQNSALIHAVQFHERGYATAKTQWHACYIPPLVHYTSYLCTFNRVHVLKGQLCICMHGYLSIYHAITGAETYLKKTYNPFMQWDIYCGNSNETPTAVPTCYLKPSFLPATLVDNKHVCYLQY